MYANHSKCIGKRGNQCGSPEDIDTAEWNEGTVQNEVRCFWSDESLGNSIGDFSVNNACSGGRFFILYAAGANGRKRCTMLITVFL